MIRCFDILNGCNSALIRIRLLPDPVKIRIRLDPKFLDPVKIRIRSDPKIWDPVHPYHQTILITCQLKIIRVVQ